MGRAGGHISDEGIGDPTRAAQLAEIFGGNIIDSYSRAEALADGVLVDPEAHVAGMVKEAGFKFPVAFTDSVWHGYIVPDAELRAMGQSVEGRLWDTLFMLRLAIKRAAANESEIFYSVYFQLTGPEAEFSSDGEATPVEIQLKSVCGPGDDGSPVLTIMLPSED